MNPSATSHRRNRRILTAMGAGLVGAGLFLTPAAAFADTGQTVVRTTDAAGDARANLHNFPTADLLAAGARINASTVTVFVDLGAAPTKAELDDAAARGLPYGGRFDYAAGIAVNGSPGFGFSIHDNQLSLANAAPGNDEDNSPEPTPACVAYFGEDRANYPVLQGPVVVNGAAGELSATFSRADVNAVQTCFGGPTLAAGTQLAVSGASADIQTAYKNILSGGVVVRDYAGAGPSVTLAD